MNPSLPARFEGKDQTFWSFVDQVLVTCPKCEKNATLRLVKSKSSERWDEYHFSCGHCGASKVVPAVLRIAAMKPADPAQWHGFRLWLQTRCRGEIFWAMNSSHLDYLRSYIAATHRQRERRTTADPNVKQVLKPQAYGFHVTSRLPRWMVLKSSRPHVLRAIARLYAKLPA
jgi:hypothetical protein